jgi:hypothetical protein
VRYFAISQKVIDRSERSRLCPSVNWFAAALTGSKFCVAILFNRS